MKRISLPVSVLTRADVLRRALDAMCRKPDGKAAAAKTAPRTSAAFNEALNTAVEKGCFAGEPPQRAQVECTGSQRGGGSVCRSPSGPQRSSISVSSSAPCRGLGGDAQPLGRGRHVWQGVDRRRGGARGAFAQAAHGNCGREHGNTPSLGRNAPPAWPAAVRPPARRELVLALLRCGPGRLRSQRRPEYRGSLPTLGTGSWRASRTSP